MNAIQTLQCTIYNASTLINFSLYKLMTVLERETNENNSNYFIIKCNALFGLAERHKLHVDLSESKVQIGKYDHFDLSIR